MSIVSVAKEPSSCEISTLSTSASNRACAVGSNAVSGVRGPVIVRMAFSCALVAGLSMAISLPPPGATNPSGRSGPGRGESPLHKRDRRGQPRSHRRQTGAIAQVSEDGPPQRRGAYLVDEVFIGQTVKAVPAHPGIPEGARQGKRSPAPGCRRTNARRAGPLARVPQHGGTRGLARRAAALE